MSSKAEISLFSDASSPSRDAVILFHGMTGSPSEVEELAHALHSNGLDCIAPRLSGHATSIADLAATPLSAWLADAEAAFAQLEKYSRVYVIGQSFGALLALHLVLAHPEKCTKAVLLSPPWTFRSRLQEYLLEALSYLPDSALTYLGYQTKKHRDGVKFRNLRHAYPQHSIAAAARVLALRRALKPRLAELRAELLLLLDPQDHHLDPATVWNFRKDLSEPKLLHARWMYGGYHELSLGPCYQKVESLCISFLTKGEDDAT